MFAAIGPQCHRKIGNADPNRLRCLSDCEAVLGNELYSTLNGLIVDFSGPAYLSSLCSRSFNSGFRAF